MTDNATPVATYESKKEAEHGPDFVKMWLDALQKSEAEEKEWRDKAEKAIETYSGKKSSKARSFNIFHSNVETICPAVYNSTPSPDVRRRYNDPDVIAKTTGDILERALEFSLDGYDFDDVIQSMIHDGEVAGRGVIRVRYEPTFGDPIIDPATKQPMLNEEGQPIPELVYQEVTSDYVPWRYFRRGPGRTWKDVPWVAFGDFLTKDEVKKINPECAEHLPYNYSGDDRGKDRKVGTEEPSIFKRALVWQIWDKDKRKIISICTDYTEKAIAVSEDPLALTGFFPIVRPYQPVKTPGSLTPIVPYELYEDLVDELNDITRRITKLVKTLRPRALYGGSEVLDVERWTNADDGDIVPATNVQAMLEGGGMEKALAWFPLDPVVKAIAQLVTQRESVKATIYEVTGISDIIRGASNPQETAQAQQIKSSWGSIRIQERQQDVARIIRDLFRLKAEIIAGKFQWSTLEQMTGIRVPNPQERDLAKQQVEIYMQQVMAAQAQGKAAPPVPPGAEVIKRIADGPVREEVEALLRSDIGRAYRIDIESDSTIRGDMTRNQQTMNQFLQGTAAFAQSIGPMVKEFPDMVGIAMEIYTSFARHFKLGKQAEDALDGMADKVRMASDQAKNKPKDEDPKMQIAKMRAQEQGARTQAIVQTSQLEVQERQMDMQAKQFEQQTDAQMLAQKAQADQQSAVVKLQVENQKLQLEQQKMQMDYARMQAEHQARQNKIYTEQQQLTNTRGPL